MIPKSHIQIFPKISPLLTVFTIEFISTNNSFLFFFAENCKCRNNVCKNRVVQNGPLENLKIEYFENKGYGLITKQSIPKYTFVCEYAGELISQEKAEKRSHNDDMNYILHICEKFTNEEHNTWIGN